MGDRKKIGLTYSYSENWVAGSYYVVNIIRALDTLEDKEKPYVFILLTSSTNVSLLKEIGYPYISFVIANIELEHWFNRALRKGIYKITGKDSVLERSLSGVDFVLEGIDQFSFVKNKYFWVHDFQEFRLPDFFTPEEAASRSELPRMVSQRKDATLILSSHDALNDFDNFFPDYQCKVKVLQFASSLPDFSDIDFDRQRAAFNIQKPFFICSNQFWQHKNHWVLLNAIRLLKDEGLSFQVVFTGKNFDHRNPGYFEELNNFVNRENLGPWVRFLGFIDRKLQLSIASHSISYIQPSLFEGWSTSVEDAKYLNHRVILSDIPVHREQLDYNVDFFDPHDPNDLAEKMRTMLLNPRPIQQRNYQENIKKFGKDLNQLFS